MRAEASGIRINEEDAAIVKGMIERGDRQHDIAAWFGVNGGRIAEISSGAKFSDIAPQNDDLPPPGPYSAARDVAQAKKELERIKTQLSDMANTIQEQLTKLG